MQPPRKQIGRKRTHQHQLPMGLTKSLEVHAGHRGRSQRGPRRKPTCRPSSELTTLLWYLAEGLGLATVDSQGAGRPPSRRSGSQPATSPAQGEHGYLYCAAEGTGRRPDRHK